MAKFKVYVTDYEYVTLKYEEKEIANLNAEFIPLQCKTEDDVIRLASDADALLVQYAPITRKVFENLKNLKIVSRYGVGVDCVDIKAATDNDVTVVNVPDYGIAEVSDHAITLLLNVIRKTTLLANDIKQHGWDFKIAVPIQRLNQMTLGVVGFGRIGKEFIKKAKAFGFKILVSDPFVEASEIEKFGVEKVEFEDLLSLSDAISIHAPLYKKTEHLFNIDVFNKMKKGSFIINTARGGLIDQVALMEAIDNGTIAGAGLDVCEAEPIEMDNKFKNMDNVVLTPHIAWYSEEAKVDLQRNTAKEVVRVLSGNAPLNPVNNKEF